MPPPNIFQRPAPRRPAPQDPLVMFEVRRAMLLHQAGRVEDAAAIYTAILRKDPAQFESLHYLGVAHLQAGRHALALASLERALAQRADDASLQSNLGLALHGLGRHADALRRLDQALALKPRLPEALNNRGWTLRALNRLEESLASFDRALAERPAFGEAQHRRASVLAALERFDEALRAFDRAIELRPHDAEIHGNQGTLLTLMGRAAEARAALARASELAPTAMAHRLKHAVAWLPLVREAGDDLAEARAAFEREMRALLEEARRVEAARPEEVVGAAQPFYLAYENADNRALLSLHGEFCAALMAQWRQARADEGRGQPVAAPDDPASGALAAARFMADADVDAGAVDDANDAASAGPDGPRGASGAAAAASPPETPSPRVRIGIVSSHVFGHSVWWAIVRGWVEQIDRRRFHLSVFHLGSTQDAETGWAQAHADAFLAGGRSLAGWVDAIGAARLDVLLYPELGMDAMTCRLAALRLAPVQAASWGHPETTGLPTIDHYLSAERFEADGSAAYYSESLVRLPGLGCCVAVESVRPSSTAAPAPPSMTAGTGHDAFAELADAPDATLFVCAGTPFKYAPEHDAVFVRIAQQLPSARFVFFRSGVAAPLVDRLMARLAGTFERAGLAPAAHLVLVPWLDRARFLDLLSRAHVFLDTIGFSGFNTVMQAVDCGLPVVTQRGDFLRGRLGSGILEQLGMADQVASDDDGVVARAVKLGRDAAAREQIRTRLAAARDRLYGDLAPIRALEMHLWRWAGRAAG